jgi:hypothetical protein
MPRYEGDGAPFVDANQVDQRLKVGNVDGTIAIEVTFDALVQDAVVTSGCGYLLIGRSVPGVIVQLPFRRRRINGIVVDLGEQVGA